jgi:hypothetical protein
MQRRISRSSHRGAVYFALSVATAVSLLVARPASAQTTDFSAEIKANVPKPVGCPEGANFCGDAIIKGLGTAQFLFLVTSRQITSEPCLDYTATATFTLADESRLTLAETGVACGMGKTFFKGSEKSFGNPFRASGTWEVRDATGQFAGSTGNGSATRQVAGAHYSGTYTGTLEG